MDQKKKNETYILIIKALVIGLLPLLSCWIYCLGQGGSLSKVFFPSSYWNDELFYYKQIESIIHFGYPRGYFGYNEGHARLLSYAAWSPVLYLPWSLFGIVFGWGLLSPMIANLVILSLTLFCFVLLVKPDRRQLITMILLFLLYRNCARYVISITPEIICHCAAILICGLALNYQEKETTGKLTWMFLLSAYATLMRPYLILFMLLPIWFAWRKWRWKGILLSGGVGLATTITYVLINRFLQAEYFNSLFSTKWLHVFLDQGIWAGCQNLFVTVIEMTKEYFKWILDFTRTGTFQGGYFIVFSVLMAVYVAECVWDLIVVLRRKKKGEDEAAKELLRKMPVRLVMAFSFIAMYFALILMYALREGARHLLIFVSAGIFVLSTIKDRFFQKLILVGIVFCYVFVIRISGEYENAIPFRTDAGANKLSYWEETLAKEIKIDTKGAPSYDNTIIWLRYDIVDDQVAVTDHGVLYALPKGMGINLINPDYAITNFDSLKSRYLLVPKGGKMDNACREAGYRVVGEYEDSIIYEKK